MTKSFNVAVVGESSVGKTSLIKKFLDPAHEVTPANPDSYWDYQDPAENAQKTLKVKGESVQLNLMEVSGSKGRMSNHYELMTAVRTADLVLFCFSAANQWTLNGMTYSINHALQSASTTPKVKVSKSRFSRKSSTPKAEEANKGKRNIPVVAVQLFSEVGDLADAEATLKPFTDTLLRASALKNEGIEEVFKTCAEVLLSQPKAAAVPQEEEEKKADSEKKEEAAPAEVPKEKEGLAGLWGKLKAKFLTGEKQEAKAASTEQQTQDTPADVAPVA